ncbi:MAG: hypothetical protein EA400_12070 [Chromatiaceae bacterium]|nr:MAG: hypothetical protein EA400_12070 [Chromatiaceae bacterium]
MRASVLLSAGLLISGVLLGLIAFSGLLAVAFSQLALMMVLSAALLLGCIFLLALTPGVARRLEECRH